MHKRRFFFLFIFSVVLCIGFACSQSVQRPLAVSPKTVEAAPTEPAEQPSEIALPPETAAIVASAGPEGLSQPPRGDVRLAVISDLNAAYGSTDYDPDVDKGIALLPFWNPDLVVCSGDMVAGQKTTLTPTQIRAMWAAFDQHVAAPLRKANLPFGFTIGNHDASSARGVGNQFLFQRERDLASEYWNNSKHDPGLQFIDRNDFPFYYTFEFQNIFFMAWDGSSSRIPPEKLAWVEKTLASPRSQQAKLRILLSHLPLYAVARGRDQPGNVMDNADALRTMLEKYDVHTYISGHHHAYYPGHRGNLQLLHTGLLGSGPRPLIAGGLPPRKTITIMDIKFDSPELTTYTTYDIQALKQIEFDQLPRFLTGHNGLVLRRDVEWEELAESEKGACLQRLGQKRCTS